MSIGWDLLWFIICVSLLVTIHEFGHYWVARRLGFKEVVNIGAQAPLSLHGPGCAPFCDTANPRDHSSLPQGVCNGSQSLD